MFLDFFSENRAVYEIMAKNMVGVRDAADDIVAHAHGILDK